MRETGYYWVKPNKDSEWCISYYDHNTGTWEIFQSVTRGRMEMGKYQDDGMWEVSDKIEEPNDI